MQTTTHTIQIYPVIFITICCNKEPHNRSHNTESNHIQFDTSDSSKQNGQRLPQEMLLLWIVNPIAISHLLQKTPANHFRLYKSYKNRGI